MRWGGLVEGVPLRFYVTKRGPPGHNFKVKKSFCFKIDAMSVPEALETTIRILLMFSIVLAHRRGTVARGPQPALECLLPPREG